MSTNNLPAYLVETRIAEAINLPRKEWRAPEELKKKFFSSHRSVGEVYHGVVLRYFRIHGLPIPKPRSLYEKEALFNDAFFNYWDEKEPVWEERKFSRALNDLRRAYGSVKDLEMASLLDVAEDILEDKAAKSSGLPYLSRKGEVLEQDYNLALALQTGRVAPPPAVAYHRSQPGKVRLVWGYPGSMMLIEGRFMLAIDTALRMGEFPYTLGLTSSGIAGRLDGLSHSNVQYCLDWSGFDSTVPRRALHAVFDVIRDWFKEIDEEAWKLVVRYFVTCPILMPDGYIYSGRRRGIPSGSWFTQLVGSMVNHLLTKYISYVVEEPFYMEAFMGDDAVLGMGRMPTVSRWAGVAKQLGMRIHPDKQVICHGDIHFLQHTWGDQTPVRPVQDSLDRLATSERFIRFDSAKAYYAYIEDKAKSLIVDNPRAWTVITDFMAWMKDEGGRNLYRQRLSCGNLMVGTTHRRGWAEADSKMPVGWDSGGRRRTLSEQILQH